MSVDKREMSYKYDSVGNIVSKTDGNGNTTSYKYNLLGQMTEEKNPLGKKIGYKYDKAANLKQVVKPSGKKISYDYNKLDAVVKKEYQDESEGKVLYGYDKDGRLISMKDKTGESLYEYDEDGVITGVKQGDGSLIKYEYDKFGNVTSLIYPDKRKVEYKYDELDRLIEVKDLSGRKVKYEYDINSNMIKSTRDDNSKTQLEYNEENRIVSLTNTLSSGKKISSYKYTYDKNGYISSEVIKAGGKTTRNNYAYNSSGELLSVYTNDSGVKKSEIYAYDKAGNKISVIRTENGFNKKINYKYNKDNALVSDSEGNSYIYDKDGNRIKKLKDGEEVLKYNYDTESRLIAVKDKKGLLFAALYDGNNNRIFTANRTEKKTKYKLYKKAPRTSVQGKEVSLFWKGFTTSLVSGFNVSSSTTGKVWNESWDDIEIAYNKRLAKEKAGRQGVVLESIKKEELEVPKSIEENKASYKTKSDIPLIPSGIKEETNTYYEIKNYVNDINRKHTQVLAAYDENGKYTESFDYGKNRLNYHTQDKSYAYQYDGRGSVSSITNKEEVVQRYNYSSYGNTLEKSKIDNPYKYNAEYIDNATGMQYLRERYYDNSSVNSNTFITRDTYAGDISNPQSQNRYNYTKSNPVNFIDPSGNFFGRVWRGIKAGAKRAARGVRNVARRVYSTARRVVRRAVDYGRRVYNSVRRHVVRGYNKVRNYVSRQYDRAKAFVNRTTNYVVRTANNYYNKVRDVYHETREYVVNTASSVYERAVESGKSAYNWGKSKLREAGNIVKSWSESLEKTVNNFCTTADKWVKQRVEKLKSVNWKRIGITIGATGAAIGATILTGGMATPAIAGIGSSVLATAATGAVAGATFGGVYTFSSGLMSGKGFGKSLVDGGIDSIKGGLIGGLTGGILGKATKVLSKASSPLMRRAGLEAVEGTVDTVEDALQGGSITAGSIVTNIVVGKLAGKGFDKLGKKKVDVDVKKAEVDFIVSQKNDKLSVKKKMEIPIHKRGEVGEKLLNKMYPGESQKYFKSGASRRYVDCFSEKIAHESKVGYTSLTKTIKKQIEKDASLVGSGSIEAAVWHFFRSDITGKVGASKNLLKELEANGIKYIIHE